MDRGILKLLLSRSRWQIERLGAAGKAGFGLIIFSVVFFFTAVLPQREEANALMIKAEAVKARRPGAPLAAGGGSIQKAPELTDFYAFFPHIDSSPFWIGEMVRVAAQHDIEISGSDYRMIREKGWPLARYEMSVPIHGGYPRVRAFIADSLRSVPAMALVDVVIKREGVEVELLEASLKFNLYLNEGKR
jgi:hypothetical protein